MCDNVKLIASVDRDIEGWVRWRASQLRIPYSQFVEEGLKLLQAKHEQEMKRQRGIYECGHCGFVGHCYGIPTSVGVSAPFCPKCQRNDKLMEVKE